MSRRLPLAPRPVPGDMDPAGLLGEAMDLLGGRSVRSRRLLGGVMAGALLGAAVAGLLLRPRPARKRRREV